MPIKIDIPYEFEDTYVDDPADPTYDESTRKRENSDLYSAFGEAMFDMVFAMVNTDADEIVDTASHARAMLLIQAVICAMRPGRVVEQIKIDRTGMGFPVSMQLIQQMRVLLRTVPGHEICSKCQSHPLPARVPHSNVCGICAAEGV